MPIDTDRRTEPRFGMFSFVDICDRRGELVAEATIRDLSENGAHLRVGSVTDIPDTLIVRSTIGRKSYPARLKWMSGNDIGVEFVEALRAHRNA